MPKKYTIEDIARRAGVSRGTVSRVINNHPSVSNETRQTVLNIIEELSYRPNFSARQMRTDNSNLVGFGLITDEVITQPYAVDMISGAQETLWRNNKVMLVVNAGYQREMTSLSLEALLERRVEGIIYAAVYHRAVELPSKILDVPIVLANCYAKDQSLPSVVPDEDLGGYTAINHLLSKGHRRIGFINLGGVVPPVAAASGRLQGYKRALTEYDVPFDSELIRDTTQTPQDNYKITLDLMSLANPPTAIFCGNDRTAMGCYGALSALGIKIPRDVAVIGFDNQKDISDGLWPPLTTIQLPHYEMGKWAVEYLAKYANDDDRPSTQHKLPCPLVERESV